MKATPQLKSDWQVLDWGSSGMKGKDFRLNFEKKPQYIYRLRLISPSSQTLFY